MTDQELIIEQARQIMELQKRVESAEDSSSLWYRKYQDLEASSMKCKPLGIDDTVPALKGAEFHA